MITVGNYKINFKHYHIYDTRLNFSISDEDMHSLMDRVSHSLGRSLNFDEIDVITECKITFKDEVVSFGYAFSHMSDQFSRSTGRKISLTRAIRTFNKEIRSKFWEEYFYCCKVK